MGKGDKKTKRGKIVNGSFGKKRLRNKKKSNNAEPISEKILKAENKETKEAVKTKTATKAKAKPAKKKDEETQD